MRKTIVILLLFATLLSCTSCGAATRMDSLDEYIETASKGEGFADNDIDNPYFFLPSLSFITDYNYVEGKYHYYESSEDLSTSFLLLKYDENTYDEAKAFALKKLPMHGDKVYEYNGYVFYENEIFVRHCIGSRFPYFFMTVCYNDDEHTLVFLGFYDKNANDSTVANWGAFIEKYYGSYHDFSV